MKKTLIFLLVLASYAGLVYLCAINKISVIWLLITIVLLSIFWIFVYSICNAPTIDIDEWDEQSKILQQELKKRKEVSDVD